MSKSKAINVKQLVKGSVLKLHNELVADMGNDFVELSKEELKTVRKNAEQCILESTGYSRKEKLGDIHRDIVLRMLDEIEIDIRNDLFSANMKDNVPKMVDHVHSHITPYDGFAGYQIDPKTKQPYRIIQDKVKNGVDEATKEILSTVVKHQISPTIKTYVITEVDKTIRARAEKVSNDLHLERIRYQANSVLQRLAEEYHIGSEDIFAEGTELHKTLLKVLLAWEVVTFGSKKDDVADIPESLHNENETVIAALDKSESINENIHSFVFDTVGKIFGGELQELISDKVADNICCTLKEYYHIDVADIFSEISDKKQERVIRQLRSWYVAFTNAIKEGAKNI